MDGEKAKFIQMLRDDHLKSRRNRYLTLHDHSTDPKTRKTLQTAIGQLEKSLSIMSPKAVAALGPLESAYFTYQVLSDDAGHVSATSWIISLSLRRAASIGNTRSVQANLTRSLPRSTTAFMERFLFVVGIVDLLKLGSSLAKFMRWWTD